jgi:CRISPR-associated DxTHG motif protein
MRRAVISVIGLAGYDRNNQKVRDKVKYSFKEKGIDGYFHNMLEVMIEAYGKDYEFIPIYTKEAKEAQREVLKAAKKEEFYEKIFNNPLGKEIEAENKENSYDLMLEKIDEIMSSFNDKDEIIIDITHGLRHLPILMLIEAIIHKIENPNKIKKIFFGKEIKEHKEYEVIDITEYLELTIFVLMLKSFEKNYTIVESFEFSNKEFEKVKKSLQEFEEYILSNSLKALIMENGTIDSVIKNLNETLNNEKVKVFEKKINDLKKHLLDIKDLYKQKDIFLAHFEMGKMLFERSYYLNSITFLIESQSLLSRVLIEKCDEEIKKRFKEALNISKKNEFNILKTSKNFFGFWEKMDKFKSDYYKVENKKIFYIQDKNGLSEKCNKRFNVELFVDIINKTNRVRNALAHIDMKRPQKNIRKRMEEVIKDYEEFLNSLNY